MVEYLVNGMISFTLSFLLGVISEWNKKIFFFTIVGSMGLTLVGLLYFGNRVYEGLDLLRLIIAGTATISGFLIGANFYKIIFRNTEE